MRTLMWLAALLSGNANSTNLEKWTYHGYGFIVQRQVQNTFAPPRYRGKVLEISQKSITIKLEGSIQVNVIHYLADGTKVERVLYIQDNNQPPKELVFSDQLLPVPNGRTLVLDGHNISDLRIGDGVEVGASRWLGVDYCNKMEIWRRPGGKVPPSVLDKKTTTANRWDTRRNAEQEREENAVASVQRLVLRLLR